MAGCGACGGGGQQSFGYDPTGQAWVDVNEYGMRPLGTDAPNCEPYHGAFQGTSVFYVGADTDKAKLFLRGQREAAWNYAVENELTFQHVNCTEFCHDRIVELFGEDAMQVTSA